MESCTLRSLPKRVALLAEGVDRNSTEMLLLAISEVALLAEGVDRNTSALPSPQKAGESPSSRRAWIEICKGDKNVIFSKSPSSRRAWIEIGLF